MDEELITVDDGDSEPYDPGPPDPEVHSDVESYDLTEIEVPNADNTGYIKLALRDQFSKDHVNDGDNPDCQGEDVGFYKFAVSSKGHAGLLQSVKSSDIEELGFYTSDKVDELLDKVLPEVTEEDNDKVLTVVDGQWGKADAPISLPEVTEEDNDKVLKVVEGEWSVAAESGGGSGLPPVTEEDNGKVLGVVDGVWDKTDPTSGTGVVELTKAEYDALTEEEKQEDKFYVLTDYTESDVKYANRRELDTFYTSSENVSAAPGQFNTLCSLNLEPGKYIITASWHSTESNARVYTHICDYNDSMYDNSGHIASTISFISIINENKTINLQVLPSRSVIFDSNSLQAIKLEASAFENYSTSEQIIGKWIDGKPLYQKSFKINNTKSSFSDFEPIEHNIENINEIVKLEGSFHRTNVGWYPIGYTEATTYPFCVLIRANTTNISYRIEYYGTDVDIIYVTIQYTKTAD